MKINRSGLAKFVAGTAAIALAASCKTIATNSIQNAHIDEKKPYLALSEESQVELPGSTPYLRQFRILKIGEQKFFDKLVFLPKKSGVSFGVLDTRLLKKLKPLLQKSKINIELKENKNCVNPNEFLSTLELKQLDFLPNLSRQQAKNLLKKADSLEMSPFLIKGNIPDGPACVYYLSSQTTISSRVQSYMKLILKEFSLYRSLNPQTTLWISTSKSPDNTTWASANIDGFKPNTNSAPPPGTVFKISEKVTNQVFSIKAVNLYPEKSKHGSSAVHLF